MKIRQANKIIKRVLRERIDTSGSELESVYRPTQRRLYKFRTYVLALARVERWEGRGAKRRIRLLDYQLHEYSWIPLPADRKAVIGFDWGVESGDRGSYATYAPMMIRKRTFVIDNSMLAESEESIADDIRLRTSKFVSEKLHEEFSKMLGQTASVFVENVRERNSGREAGD